MKRVLQILLPLLVFTGGVFGAVWLMQNPRVTAPRIVEKFNPRVELVTVKLEDYRPVIRSQGTVKPRMWIGLSPEVSGRVVSMSSVLVEGGLFKEGEELLQVEAIDYELAQRQALARIDTARASITNAFAQMSGTRAQIAQAEARIVREEAEASAALAEWLLLGRAGKPPVLLAREPQLKEAHATLDSAEALFTAASAKRQSDEAELVAARAAGEQATTNLARCVVRAPFNGRVSTRSVGVGQVVSPALVLAQLQAIGVAEVRLALTLEKFRLLELPGAFRGGTNVENGPVVRLRPTHQGEAEWRGRIVRSVGEVDSGTRMMAVVANVTDPYRQAPGASGSALSFGMFVKAEIDGREMKDVVVLPREVLRGADAVHIFKDGKLYARKVRVAWSTREEVVVAGGLQAGEQVCLTPVDAFVEGMSVILMEDSGGE